MADIHYMRILKSSSGAVWGEMEVRGKTFVGVENRSAAYNSLPGGESGTAALYNLRMTTKLGEHQCPCLQFVGVMGRKGVNEPFLIHRAYKNNWRTLAGCIAPGTNVSGAAGEQLVESEEAMNDILHLLGDWKDGREGITIEIENHAPGDTLSQDEFISRRKQGLSTGP